MTRTCAICGEPLSPTAHHLRRACPGACSRELHRRSRNAWRTRDDVHRPRRTRADLCRVCVLRASCPTAAGGVSVVACVERLHEEIVRRGGDQGEVAACVEEVA